METRVLVPAGLKLVIVDARDKNLVTAIKVEPGEDQDFDEEKPSSSSGQVETSSEPKDSCGRDSSSSGSSTGSSPDTSDNEVDTKSEHRIGSSTRSRKRDKDDDNEDEPGSSSYLKICTSRLIPKGQIFTPNEGDVQVAHLNGIPNIPKDDVRFIFGCFESITHLPMSPVSGPAPSTTTPEGAVTPPPSEEKKSLAGSNSNIVRLCNWVRFVRRSRTPPKGPPRKILKVCQEDEEGCNSDSARLTLSSSNSGHNILARFSEGRPVFQVLESLVPGTELRVHFDINSFLVQTSNLSASMSGYGTDFGGKFTLAGATVQDQPYKKESEEVDAMRYSQQHVSPYIYDYNRAPGRTSKFLQDSHLNQFKCWRNERDNCQESPASCTNDGPLDLTRSFQERKSPAEPLKIGTPFDSPDSHDDKTTASSSSASSESGRESSFSIRNVLKIESKRPSKLFQPYSSDTSGQRSTDGSSSFISSLAMQPTSHQLAHQASLESPLGLRTSSSGAVGMRPILRTRGRERSLLPCEVCGKAFDRPSLLKRHLRTHTGEKPHICDVCSKGFSTSSSLNTHRRIHSGEKPHQCPICGKRFTASSNLYYHRMTHNKEKPHKCMLCGKSFPTPGDLKSHQYVHSGSWPYNCPVCHRGFSKQTNLRNHLLLHSSGMASSMTGKTVDKPYACQICDKKFAQTCTLRAHMKIHEGQGSSAGGGTSCTICKRHVFLPEMLNSGRCRDCVEVKAEIYTNPGRNFVGGSISTGGNSGGGAGVSTQTAEKVTESCYPTGYDVQSLLNQRILPLASQQSLPSGMAQFGLGFPGLSAGLSSALGFPTSGFGLGTTGNGSHTNPVGRNPLLDQIFEWNYRIAKESAGLGGNLGLNLMHQKFLESHSRVLAAAQLINSHGFVGGGMSGAMQDLLGLRSGGITATASPQTGFQSGETCAESKFGTR